MKIFLTILFLISQNNLFAQKLDQGYDAIMQIRNTIPISPQEVTFELHLRRFNQNWERFANGTFQLKFYRDPLGPALKIDYSTIEFTLEDGTSDLNIILDPDVKPSIKDIGSQYYLNTSVNKDEDKERFLVTILGPENYQDAQIVPETDDDLEFEDQTTVKVGKFRIKQTNLDERIIQTIRWIEPIPYFQACAFKLDSGRTIYGVTDYYENDDNLELLDPVASVNTRFLNDPQEPPPFRLAYFDAKYNGSVEDSTRGITLNWKTDSEVFLNGFVIRRVKLDFFATDAELADLLKYDQGEVVFHYDPNFTLSNGQHEKLQSTRQYKNYPTEYGPVLDRLTTEQIKNDRGKWYCYLIYKVDYKSEGRFDPEFPLAQAFVQIPNSIISYAKASPNPFAQETRIDYELDDDVELDLALYDMQGRKVKQLYGPGRIQYKGNHSFLLSMPESANQGVYNLIFNVTKQYDDQVKNSVATIKLHMVK